MSRVVPMELIDFLVPFSDEVREITVGLRERVLSVLPNAHEFVWDATNAVSLVYTPTTRWTDGVVHIASYSTRVNLGFNDGALLEDPLGILTGTGTRIRHASLKTVGDLQAPWIEEYIRLAVDHAGLPLDMGDGGTTIRVSAGPKRRPA